MQWIVRITWKSFALNEMYSWEATPAALLKQLADQQPQIINDGDSMIGIELATEAPDRGAATAHCLGLFFQALVVLGIPQPAVLDMETTKVIDSAEQLQANVIFDELVAML